MMSEDDVKAIAAALEEVARTQKVLETSNFSNDWNKANFALNNVGNHAVEWLTELLQERARLVAVLEWYAHECDWDIRTDNADHSNMAAYDRGARARDALAAREGE